MACWYPRACRREGVAISSWHLQHPHGATKTSILFPIVSPGEYCDIHSRDSSSKATMLQGVQAVKVLQGVQAVKALQGAHQTPYMFTRTNCFVSSWSDYEVAAHDWYLDSA